MQNTSNNTSLHSKLCLLQCISKYTGPKDIDSKRHEPSLEPIELRRAFTNQVSYLCDGRKDGTTVTGCFVQASGNENVLWVASNEGVEQNVRTFLEWMILEVLRVVTNESRNYYEEKLLVRAVALAADRLRFYQRKMCDFAKGCINSLTHCRKRVADARMLITKIRQLQNISWHDKLSTACYKARGDGKLQSLLSTIPAQLGISDNCFTELAHYIGRLGAHAFAVKTVIGAALSLPSIKGITQVQYEACPPGPEGLTMDIGHTGPYELVRNILEARPDMHLRQKLQLLEAFVSVDMQKNLTAQYRSQMDLPESFKTVVHAELQLCDLASRKNMRFLDDDPYVGCSKPSCYFCQRYLMSHHRGFIIPPSHNKVLTGVRAPAADPKRDIKGRGAALLRTAQMNMEWKVEEDILDELRTGSSTIQFQHCSTDGFDLATSVITTQMGQ
ncbi:hypothetical protein PG985_003543 [Apiospora marii]